MRAFQSLLVFALLGCVGGTDPEPPLTAQSGLRALVGAVLAEYNHEVAVTCPCRVEQGVFPSMEECLRRLGHAPSLADCVSEKLKPSDGVELRSSLHCGMSQYKVRADCLESRGCAQEEVQPCYDLRLDCPVLDPQALTRALLECPNATLLSR